RAADLPRLLGVLRHRDRICWGPGVCAARELQLALSQRQPPGVLAALAHLAVDLAARLPLRHARRQPRRAVADLRESRMDEAARRPVARRELGVRGVGRAPWLWPRGDALLPAQRAPGGHAARALRADRD